MRTASGNQIAWAGAWSRTYNNVRYAELLPRLTNVDKYFVDMHPWWPIRGFRRRIWLPCLLRWIGLNYPLVFSTDWRQIHRIRHRVVCDHDDPLYSRREISSLNRPNVALVVVTTEEVRKNLGELGLHTPMEVVPQGVPTIRVPPERIREIRSRWLRTEEDIVVGLHQPRFAFSSELASDPVSQMYAVNSLFDAMMEAVKTDPRLVLWLVGRPSDLVEDFAASHPWIRLLGYHDRSTLLETVSSFDIGAYPRTGDIRGWNSIKLIEYMGCGVPVVGFDVGEMKPVVAAKGGCVVRDIAEFASALTVLARDTSLRREMSDRGRKAAAAYSWDDLSIRYQRLLDQYLPSRCGGI
jgi:glycosyltransferase involved in cell wall biosynthesis